MNDLVFAVDPGSIRSGWAVLDRHEQLLAGGLLLPDKIHIDSEFRINSMCQDLWQLLDEWRPNAIVIEYGSGKINIRRHHGQGSGMQIHGVSIGALWREAVAWWRALPAEQQLETKVILITENKWTRGVRKEERAAAIAAMFPKYNPAKDPGYDLADAVGLASWYQREHLLRAAELIKAQDKK